MIQEVGQPNNRLSLLHVPLVGARVDGYALLALLLTVLAWAALLGPDYFMGAHDAHHSLFFPIEFDKGIRDGYWLPRWGPDFAHGYGYPILVFYAPLSFYIWEGVHLTGLFGVVASTKATFAIGFLLGAAGVYAYARALWGKPVALLAAVVYTFLPYHLLNIFVRAALAEFMAMGLLPWIALAFRRLVRRPSLLTAAGAAGSYGALLWTHNITALTFTPLLGLLILFELALVARERGWRGFFPREFLRRALPIAGSIALGVALGTAIWLPGLAEQGSIRIEQWAMQTYQYSDHFVLPSQLLSPEWGFGYSVPGTGDGMSFQLGIAALLLAGLGLVAMGEARAPHEGARRLAWEEGVALWLFFLISLVVLVALTLPVAKPLWDIGPLSTLIQFPWRVLAVASLPLALVAGQAARLVAPRGGLTPGLALALLLVLVTTSGYTQPRLTPPNPRDETQQTWRDYERDFPDMVGMVAGTQQQPSDSPMRAALEANQPPLRWEALTPGVLIEAGFETGSDSSARVVASEPATIRFQSYWYPGWQATLDGEPVAIQSDGGPLGLMMVTVPPGEHLLRFRFGDPPLRRAATLVSLASLLGLAGLVVLGARRTRAA